MEDRVGIVIPAYRPDADRLGQYIEALDAAIDPARIHVELDQPSEAVLRRLDDTGATVSAVSHRRGKGAAITAGFDQLETPILAFVDADGSTPAASLRRILAPVLAGDADLAVGSRRHPDSNVNVHQSRLRRRLGDLFVTVARIMLPVSLYDYQCGAKALTRESWQRIRGALTSPGFAWDIELLCEADAIGARTIEVPITWEDRPGSTVPVRSTGIAFGKALLRGWHRGRLNRGSRVHRWIDHRRGRPTPLVDRAGLYGQDPGTPPG